MQKTIASNIEVLLQLKSALLQLTNQQYAAPLKVLSQSSIGMHVRHVVEFYICLLAQVNDTVICYDKRARDLKIENDITFTIETLQKIEADLQNLDANKNLQLSTNTTSVITENETCTTSLKRELIYTMDHAIHHLALVKIGVNTAFSTVVLSENFGVAPSTILHKQTK